ncbi:MAG TPA: arginine--tRNA ligase [Gemmatimonadales bacterium]|nr:arginine--tRNA ligase [Gemmatimonadales bacterium]
MSEPLRAALAAVAAELGAADIDFTLERPRDLSHGDLSTNLAMQLARRERTNPRAMAERVLAALESPAGLVESTTIAGPGFINFRFAPGALSSDLAAILASGDRYGRNDSGAGQRVNVEFVSANPTGPLHVGHGRGAALGDAIATLLEWTGHEVTREFYVNDAGVQIDNVVASLWARIRQAAGHDVPFPEKGYHGEYLRETAAQWLQANPGSAPVLADQAPPADLRAYVLGAMRAEQDETMARFGVRFDVITSEQAVYDQGKVDAALARFAAAGLSYENDGALWLRTSEFGDEKDRVARKQDGSYTYFVPDIAYHLDKHSRGFCTAIDVWGADHHGYVARLSGALVALGIPREWFEVTLVQLVKVVRGGEEAKMSKRSGEFVTLQDLYEETGVDAARYWFLMRRGDSHLVFDIELATARTDENPVYYVQMAHARMSGILRNAGAEADVPVADFAIDSLDDPDLALLKALTALPETVARAAREREPHRITNYLEELARSVHAWYHGCRVLGEPPAVQRSRLLLARAARQVLANGLNLLGVTAPDRM